ncbi:hypothetical protein GUJ93_ZPchr0013g34918 [Zizania palustris]|uniref:Uncharacterized protein n=1 Tax=Zizania palustris TaxID=103762 RepID=A0A8J5X0I4_ZIZPA|nr:hypothetical protein GUJ93_ZPchr0013g34918 [Zizania palustris]
MAIKNIRRIKMKMGNGRWLPSTMIIVTVLAYLAVHSHCGRRTTQLVEGRNSRGSRRDGAAVNSAAAAAAADDESKLYLVFCVRQECDPLKADYDDPRPMPVFCFCCVSKEGPLCYRNEKECRANCPVCNPICAPPHPAGAGDDASVHA